MGKMEPLCSVHQNPPLLTTCCFLDPEASLGQSPLFSHPVSFGVLQDQYRYICMQPFNKSTSNTFEMHTLCLELKNMRTTCKPHVPLLPSSGLRIGPRGIPPGQFETDHLKEMSVCSQSVKRKCSLQGLPRARTAFWGQRLDWSLSILYPQYFAFRRHAGHAWQLSHWTLSTWLYQGGDDSPYVIVRAGLSAGF